MRKSTSTTKNSTHEKGINVEKEKNSHEEKNEKEKEIKSHEQITETDVARNQNSSSKTETSKSITTRSPKFATDTEKQTGTREIQIKEPSEKKDKTDKPLPQNSFDSNIAETKSFKAETEAEVCEKKKWNKKSNKEITTIQEKGEHKNGHKEKQTVQEKEKDTKEDNGCKHKEVYEEKRKDGHEDGSNDGHVNEKKGNCSTRENGEKKTEKDKDEKRDQTEKETEVELQQEKEQKKEKSNKKGENERRESENYRSNRGVSESERKRYKSNRGVSESERKRYKSNRSDSKSEYCRSNRSKSKSESENYRSNRSKSKSEKYRSNRRKRESEHYRSHRSDSERERENYRSNRSGREHGSDKGSERKRENRTNRINDGDGVNGHKHFESQSASANLRKRKTSEKKHYEEKKKHEHSHYPDSSECCYDVSDARKSKKRKYINIDRNRESTQNEKISLYEKPQHAKNIFDKKGKDTHESIEDTNKSKRYKTSYSKSRNSNEKCEKRKVSSSEISSYKYEEKNYYKDHKHMRTNEGSEYAKTKKDKKYLYTLEGDKHLGVGTDISENVKYKENKGVVNEENEKRKNKIRKQDKEKQEVMQQKIDKYYGKAIQKDILDSSEAGQRKLLFEKPKLKTRLKTHIKTDFYKIEKLYTPQEYDVDFPSPEFASVIFNKSWENILCSDPLPCPLDQFESVLYRKKLSPKFLFNKNCKTVAVWGLPFRSGDCACLHFIMQAYRNVMGEKLRRRLQKMHKVYGDENAVQHICANNLYCAGESYVFSELAGILKFELLFGKEGDGAKNDISILYEHNINSVQLGKGNINRYCKPVETNTEPKKKSKVNFGAMGLIYFKNEKYAFYFWNTCTNVVNRIQFRKLWFMADMSGLKIFLEAAGRFVSEEQMKKKEKYKVMQNVLTSSKRKYISIMEEVKRLKQIHGNESIWNFIFKKIDVSIYCKKKPDVKPLPLMKNKSVELGETQKIKNYLLKKQSSFDRQKNSAPLLCSLLPSLETTNNQMGKGQLAKPLDINREPEKENDQILKAATIKVKQTNVADKNKNGIEDQEKEKQEKSGAKKKEYKTKRGKPTTNDSIPEQTETGMGSSNEYSSEASEKENASDTLQDCPHFNVHRLQKKLKSPGLRNCFNNFLTFAAETSIHTYLAEKGYRLIACPYLDLDRGRAVAKFFKHFFLLDWFYYKFDQICYFFLPDFVLNALSLFKKCFNTFNNLIVSCVYLETACGVIPAAYIFKASFPFSNAYDSPVTGISRTPSLNRFMRPFNDNDKRLLETQEVRETSEIEKENLFVYKVNPQYVQYHFRSPFVKETDKERQNEKQANDQRNIRRNDVDSSTTFSSTDDDDSDDDLNSSSDSVDSAVGSDDSSEEDLINRLAINPLLLYDTVSCPDAAEIENDENALLFEEIREIAKQKINSEINKMNKKNK